ncbi:hypothetical protein ZYGR_0A02410 [Zygosaccharomyces rouxii]|uniref:ZYRO0A05456p n=2 Tax=Zygosaccharomyces rouxii TaxID=4956 RepID=C5DPR4_ZYGRC|nr:uncharacterized protein ZYRO0A05456g [Zygosaccharomyces rouxii]KAH9198804.1 pre-mRNA processing factor 3-domain-containing protein [Zygosaccharomyces rouxii]GAV46648.1 hypothetical protein ZYGR_0A02410 [Zygosaccharomyces rouxii]CAR25675.1 ZYRO0A05456p [Zygosaccharomyces rouxii]
MPAKKDDSAKGRNRGLQTEINPLLLSSNPNLIRRQYRGQNPYLSTYGVEDKKIRKRFEKGLKFHEKGEISANIERERELLKAEKEQELKRREFEAQRREEVRKKVECGELPDTSIGEEKFAPREVPIVEWWDKPFLDDQLNILSKYTADTIAADDEESEDEDDERPSIRYVEHPVPIKADSSRPVAKVYLTKSEQKRIRRNRRKLQREEHETRIKMGLEPKLEPKVSLRNMMSVYENNQNITDPTAWESTVRQQVASRKRKHEEMNAARHEEAQQNKKAKNETITPGDHCKVFRFQNLSNPRIRFKLKTNAQQLSLKGLCLRVGENGSGIIVIVGSEKSCKFYDKLVTRRIHWDETFENKETHETADMSGNHAEKVWEGEWEGPSWGPFFMKICQDRQEMEELLRQRNAEHLITSINGK